MDVNLNGEKIDITLEGEKTIGDFLKAFETEASKNDAAIIGLSVDGRNINSDEINSLMSMEIKSDTKIDISAITKAEVEEFLKSSGKQLDELSEKIKEIPVLLQTGKNKDASALITDLADGIDAFCNTATLFALFPAAYNSFKIEDKAIAEFFEEFAPVIADFENAFKDNDTVTVGDLCEYEISPKLKNIASAIESFKD